MFKISYAKLLVDRIVHESIDIYLVDFSDYAWYINTC